MSDRARLEGQLAMLQLQQQVAVLMERAGSAEKQLTAYQIRDVHAALIGLQEQALDKENS